MARAQAGKVTRALAVLEAAPRRIASPPDVGQITLACALGYRDFRFPGSWRGDHPRLVAWLADFAARVPAFAATTPTLGRRRERQRPFSKDQKRKHPESAD